MVLYAFILLVLSQPNVEAKLERLLYIDFNLITIPQDIDEEYEAFIVAAFAFLPWLAVKILSLLKFFLTVTKALITPLIKLVISGKAAFCESRELVSKTAPKVVEIAHQPTIYKWITAFKGVSLATRVPIGRFPPLRYILTRRIVWRRVRKVKPALQPTKKVAFFLLHDIGDAFLILIFRIIPQRCYRAAQKLCFPLENRQFIQDYGLAWIAMFTQGHGIEFFDVGLVIMFIIGRIQGIALFFYDTIMHVVHTILPV